MLSFRRTAGWLLVGALFLIVVGCGDSTGLSSSTTQTSGSGATLNSDGLRTRAIRPSGTLLITDIDDESTRFRVTGSDAAGNVLYGPAEFSGEDMGDLRKQVRAEEVPLGVTRVMLEVYYDDQLMTVGAAPVKLTRSGDLRVAFGKLSWLRSIEVSPASIELPKGFRQRLVAIGHFKHGVSMDLTEVVLWSSSSPAVEVNAGEVYGAQVSGGPVEITAGVGPAPHTPAWIRKKVRAISAGSAEVTITPAVLTEIEVRQMGEPLPTGPAVPLGLTTNLIATGILSDGEKQDITDTAQWTSSNPAVASVTSDGIATGIALGSTQIGVSQNGISGSLDLTVSAPVATALRLEASAAEPGANLSKVPLGTTIEFQALATFSDGSERNVSEGAVWDSSNVDSFPLSLVGSGDEAKVVASAVSLGSSTVSAGYEGQNASLESIAVSAALRTLELDPEQLTLPLGRSQNVTARGTFSDGSSVDVTEVVSWLAEGAATVSNAPGEKGKVTAVAIGATQLTAIYLGEDESETSASIPVTVNAAAFVQITIDGPSSLGVGLATELTASAMRADGSEYDVTAEAIWTSSDDSILEVSNGEGQSGQVVARSTGEAIVTATLDGVSGQLTIAAAEVPAELDGWSFGTEAEFDPLLPGSVGLVNLEGILAPGPTQSLSLGVGSNPSSQPVNKASSSWTDPVPGLSASGQNPYYALPYHVNPDAPKGRVAEVVVVPGPNPIWVAADAGRLRRSPGLLPWLTHPTPQWLIDLGLPAEFAQFWALAGATQADFQGPNVGLEVQPYRTYIHPDDGSPWAGRRMAEVDDELIQSRGWVDGKNRPGQPVGHASGPGLWLDDSAEFYVIRVSMGMIPSPYTPLPMLPGGEYTMETELKLLPEARLQPQPAGFPDQAAADAYAQQALETIHNTPGLPGLRAVFRGVMPADIASTFPTIQPLEVQEVEAGDTLVIEGTNLATTKAVAFGQQLVQLDPSPTSSAVVRVINDNRLEVTVPQVETGLYQVVVRTERGFVDAAPVAQPLSVVTPGGFTGTYRTGGHSQWGTNHSNTLLNLPNDGTLTPWNIAFATVYASATGGGIGSSHFGQGVVIGIPPDSNPPGYYVYLTDGIWGAEFMLGGSSGHTGALTANHGNGWRAESTSAGVFARNVMALKFNVDFADPPAGSTVAPGYYLPSGFGGLRLAGTGTSLDGQSVRQILAAANLAVGGGPLPAGFTYTSLNELCYNLNWSFNRYIPSDWAMQHLRE